MKYIYGKNIFLHIGTAVEYEQGEVFLFTVLFDTGRILFWKEPVCVAVKSKLKFLNMEKYNMVIIQIM